MILIGAIAAAIGLTKLHLDTEIRNLNEAQREAINNPFASRVELSEYVWAWFLATTVWLSVGSLALVMIGLRKPCQPVRRLALRPGMAAGLAASAALLPQVLIHVVLFAIREFPGWSIYYEFGIEYYSTRLGLVVGGVWLVLALARRWRPHRGWIDRAGRMLGAAWIIATLGLLTLEGWFNVSDMQEASQRRMRPPDQMPPLPDDDPFSPEAAGRTPIDPN